ncbi:MAG: EutN/CcmL family microcompartment protein [Nocardioidaceae bacterium]
MIKASVIGPVWATKRLTELPAGALLELEDEASTRHLVALDQLGAGPGDRVLVALGSAVAHHLVGNPPIDALIVGVLDELTSAAPENTGNRTVKERKSTK